VSVRLAIAIRSLFGADASEVHSWESWSKSASQNLGYIFFINWHCAAVDDAEMDCTFFCDVLSKAAGVASVQVRQPNFTSMVRLSAVFDALLTTQYMLNNRVVVLTWRTHIVQLWHSTRMRR